MPEIGNTSVFSQTDSANNTSTDPGWPEGMASSRVNDAARALQGAIARDWQWKGPTVTAGGTATALTLTYSVAPAAYYQGMSFTFIVGTTNTGAATINVNALGAKNIFREGKALAGGELVAGNVATVAYDGTQFVLLTPPAGLSATASYKNSLLNGGCEVWQRGAGGSASIAIVANTATQVMDGWFFINAGNTGTVSQVAGLTNGSRWACKVQRTAGQTSTNIDRLEHTFWLDKIIPMLGQIVTVSFTAKVGANYSSASNQIGVQLYCGTGTAQKRQATGYTGESTPLSNGGISLTTTATQYTVVSSAVIPTTTTQMALQFQRAPVGTAGVDDSFTIDDIQIEIGGISTPFDRRPFNVELAECQYLYRKTFPYATAPAQSGGNTGAVVVYTGTGVTGTVGATVSYQPMRVAPTVTSYNPGAANANVRDTTNSADRTITVDTASDNSFPFSFASAVAAATNRVHFTMDAAL